MKKSLTKGMAALLVAALVVTPASPVSAAAKKVALSKKKVVLRTGEKQKIKIKNTKKKVKWSIKSGKKYIKLQNKKKNSVVIRAKKTGTAKVQAKVGKKKYICKVTVKKAKAAPQVPTATPLWTAPPSSVLNPTSSPSGGKEPDATAVPVEKDAGQVKALQTLIQKINLDIREESDAEEIAEEGWLVSTDVDDTSQYEWDSQGNLSMINWAGKGIIEESLSFSAFPGLRELYCQDNWIEKINVSGNPKLEDLFCYNCGLESLNVNSNPELIELNCYLNSISAKDFKYNKCTKLQTFRCGWNNELNSINVSNMPDLKTLECSDSAIATTIDVSANEKLVELNCSGNDEMGKYNAQLIVSNNPMLKTLNCSDCKLTSLDISSDTALVTLNCSGNALKSLNTDNNTLLQTLDCGWNGNTLLEEPLEDGEDDETTGGDDFVDDGTDADGTGTDTGADEEDPLGQSVTLQMDVSKNTNLTKLICSGNGLYSLDVSNSPELAYLDCSDNYLKVLDIHNNTKLSILNCRDNSLTSLNIGANPLLWDSTTLQYDEGVSIIQS